MGKHLDNVGTQIISGRGANLNVLRVEILPDCEVATFIREYLNSSERLCGVPLILDDDSHGKVCTRYESPSLKIQHVYPAGKYCWELSI